MERRSKVRFSLSLSLSLSLCSICDPVSQHWSRKLHILGAKVGGRSSRDVPRAFLDCDGGFGWTRTLQCIARYCGKNQRMMYSTRFNGFV